MVKKKLHTIPKSSKEVLNELNDLGQSLSDKIKRGENPFMEIPVRSFSNIEYDEKNKLLQLGDAVSKRYFFNVAHAKKFMQTALVASLCKELLQDKMHVSLREAFYSLKRTIQDTKENTFDEQKESDACFVDLETIVDVLRENLHINADRRGTAAGNVVIQDRGDKVDWSKLGSAGWAIPSNIEEIEFKKLKGKYILVAEKNATFDRLHEDRYWDKHNCIIIGTQGQAARGARRLISRLHNEFDIPVYVFTDADAYGWYIYSVLKIGSMNLAHASESLSTPSAKFLGLTLTDIETYGLQDAIIKAKDVDVKRAIELQKYDWFQKPEWQKELKIMKTKKIKAEQEALARRHLRFVSETYLPEKIKNQEFLP